jgi:hypothetical protein
MAARHRAAYLGFVILGVLLLEMNIIKTAYACGTIRH